MGKTDIEIIKEFLTTVKDQHPATFRGVYNATLRIEKELAYAIAEEDRAYDKRLAQASRDYDDECQHGMGSF